MEGYLVSSTHVCLRAQRTVIKLVNMSRAPTISVVVPVHNAAPFIEEGVRSVLAQSWPAHEIIVVDDGSTDMDYRILSKLDPLVKVIRQPQSGVSRARNVGCEAASGECVALLDADDVWFPDKLARQADYLNAHQSVGAVFTRGWFWRPSRDSWVWPSICPAERSASASIVRYKDFILGIPASPSSLVIRKEILRSVGKFDETLSRGEDFEFYFRLAFRNTTAVLHGRHVLYRRHDSNTTNKYCGYNAHAEVIKRSVRALGRVDAFGNPLLKSELRRRLARIHFQDGYANFWGGHPLDAIRECALSVAFGGGHNSIAYCVASAVPGSRYILRAIKRLARPAEQAEKPSEEALIELPREPPVSE